MPDLYRRQTNLGHFFGVFASFLALLVDVFLEPVFAEEYPSAYHPPPTSLKEQADKIFLARRLHLCKDMYFFFDVKLSFC
jgi:hypothetical protein